jgi:hypothetical protein
VTALAIAGCGHSPVSSVPVDRWMGAWQAGAPTRLTAHGVAPAGISEDGHSILYLRTNKRPIREPDGLTPPWRDTADVCVGLVPAGGGSGLWEYCDRPPGQRDSVNVIVAAAVSRTGQLLYVTATGPLDTVSPVREHWELYLADTAQPAVRQRLATLYRDREGQAVVPPGTINALGTLQWIGPTRFVAIGSYLEPDLKPHPSYIGAVLGQIGADSAVLTPLQVPARIRRFAAGPNGTILAEGADRAIYALAATDGSLRGMSTLPDAPDRDIAGLGCTVRGCIVLTRDAFAGIVGYWRLNPTGGVATLLGTLPVPLAAATYLAPDGAVIYSTPTGLFRIDPPSSP